MALNETLKACIRNAISLEQAHVGRGQRLDTARAAEMMRAQANIAREMFGADWTLEDEVKAAQETRELAASLNLHFAGTVSAGWME